MNSLVLPLRPGAAVQIMGAGVAGWAAAAVLARAGHRVGVCGYMPALAGPLPADVAALRALETLVGARLPGWWPGDGLWLADDWPVARGRLALWQPQTVAQALQAIAQAAGARQGPQPRSNVFITAQPAPSAWHSWTGHARGARPAWAIMAQQGGHPSAVLARSPDDRLLLMATGAGALPAATLASLALAGGGQWAQAMGALALDPRPLPRPLGWPVPLRPGLAIPEPGPFGLAALVTRLAHLARGKAVPALLPETLPNPVQPEETDDEDHLPDVAAAASHRLWQR
jgi:hypothetical protein